MIGLLDFNVLISWMDEETLSYTAEAGAQQRKTSESILCGVPISAVWIESLAS